MSKKDSIKKYVLNGEIQKASSIARSFFFGLTNEEKESIEIAADTKCDSKKEFYKSIGIDTEYHLANAGIILFQKYC